jgi:uncharacterized damage-inducible protein DinB
MNPQQQQTGRISAALLPEFDHEMATTRRTLERVPEDKFDWAPHERSMKLGHLASHLAEMPSWATVRLKQDSLDLAPVGGPAFEQFQAASRAQVLDRFDKNVAAARAAIADTDDPEYVKPWSLLRSGQTLMTMPKIAVVRSFVMNHIIHHRGQLSVYLRLNNVPVPSIYGPSADEGSM